jgi:hypothetical protein
MHLDDERVQRLLHGELEPAGERLVRQHLAACDVCRALVDDARVEERHVFGLLREVDHPLPEADPGVILTSGPRRIRWERWAAGLVLVAAAGGAAYAAPGSPLPGALDRLVAMLAPTQSLPAGDPTASDAAAPASGVAVAPGDRLTIRFVAESDGAFATLSLTDGHEVVVRAVEGAATFSSDVERLSVSSAGPVRFEILIPRSAPWVEILAGDTRVFRKRVAAVTTEAKPDADGRYRLSLASPVP